MLKMINNTIAILRRYPFVICGVALVLYAIFNRYGRGLSRFNGPFLASLKSLWGMWNVWSTADRPPYVHLHEKYGHVVRLSPNKLSFAQPAAIRDIYGPNGLTQKSDLHLVSQQTSRGVAFPTLFSTTDSKWHDSVRRCVNFGFSMTTMVQYEAYVNETIKVFLQQIEARFAGREGPGGVIDFPTWLHFFTDDTITNVTYGKMMGHLEAGEDVNGILAYMYAASKYHILVAQAPSIDYAVRKNPLYMWVNRHGWFNPSPSKSVPFAMKRQQERRQLLAEKKMDGDTEEQTLTDKFIHAAETHPDIMGNNEVLAMGLSIIAAGSDTTAISLSAVFYYLLKNPECYRKLMEEVDATFSAKAVQNVTYSLISFAEAQRLPYLNACIKETFRLHPATRWFPERVVPASGHTICGEHIPGGTVVGVSAWVLHRNTDIFGHDVEIFRPERWLDGNIEKVREMDRMLSHFGSAGNYTCIGKNIALLEMYKFVPAVIRYFEVRFCTQKLILNEP
jgi:cytochrome P450